MLYTQVVCVILSVYSLCKKLCMDNLHDFFNQKQILAQCQGDFILEVIRINLHCHLEVTVAQEGHLGLRIKLTVSQKR